MGKLSTHVLDTARGTPAGGIQITACRVNDNGERITVGEFKTNADGRIDGAIVAGDNFVVGIYELDFSVGDYFRALSVSSFFEVITIRFIVTDVSSNYHVPLLLSPFGYSTYRGS